MTTKQPRTIADVYLHGSLCGHIVYDDEQRYFGFAYAKSFLTTSPLRLSVSLPRTEEINWHSTRAELPPYFYNLLPEGWLLDVAKTIKVDISTPEAAITHLCRDTIGAVAVYPPGEPFVATDIANEIETEVLPSATHAHVNCIYCHRLLARPGENLNYHPACAKLLFGTEKPPVLSLRSEDLLRVAQRQLRLKHSLPGVQPKFSGRLKDHRSTLVLPGRFILKPEPKDDYYKDIARIETASMHFATFLTLPVALSGLLYLTDGTPVFVTRRFDRHADGTPIHAEDFAQARGINRKYKGSLEQVAEFLNETLAPLPADEALEAKASFLRLCLFNYLLGNSDNHLKNCSLLHLVGNGAGVTRQAPFYDLFPARAYATDDEEETGLTLAGRKANFAAADFRGLAARLDVPEREVDKFIRRVKDGARFFKQACRVMRVQEARTAAVEQHIESRLEDLSRRSAGKAAAKTSRASDEQSPERAVEARPLVEVDGRQLAADPETCEHCGKNKKEKGRRRYCASCGALSDQGRLVQPNASS